MQLYTSLVRLKQSMNGGRMPPMTPVPTAAHELIDPSFTPGLGALEEDDVLGLRCPVRGCGLFMRRLDTHIASKHAPLGGVAAVRRALSIPKSAPLIAASYRKRMSDTAKRCNNLPKTSRTEMVARARRSVAGRRSTMGARNLRDRCDAQLAHRITDLANKLGRSPNAREFRTEYGCGVFHDTLLAYGSWASAKTQCGLLVYRNMGKLAASDVLPAIQAWYEHHGSLPSTRDADCADRAPAIPSRQRILSALKSASWTDAMERAAALLDIHGGRYGLPVRKEA